MALLAKRRLIAGEMAALNEVSMIVSAADRSGAECWGRAVRLAAVLARVRLPPPLVRSDGFSAAGRGYRADDVSLRTDMGASRDVWFSCGRFGRGASDAWLVSGNLGQRALQLVHVPSGRVQRCQALAESHRCR
jgi:hypothetical protein